MLMVNTLTLAAALLLTATLAHRPLPAQTTETPRTDRPFQASVAEEVLVEIARLLSAGQHRTVIEKVDQFVKGTPVSLESVPALLMKAESQYRLGDGAAAVETYADALAKLERVTSNVTRRRFFPAYLRFAQILREQRQLAAAVTAVETALRLAPQNVEGQIFLGHLLNESGQGARALTHYRAQLVSPLPVAEERAVLAMKIDRLTGSRSADSMRPADLASSSIHSGLSIAIVPVNHNPPTIALSDVCVVLEASWRVPCEVLTPLMISEAEILDSARSQYKADLLLAEIARRLPRASRRQSHVLAVTDRDIFAPKTNFVFSWQRSNEVQAEGVLSTSRFGADIPDYYEPATIATRRVALQALSTTGSMFGFTRPTDPQCPLAYPESLREFQQKRLRLCASEEVQRDALLQRRGGPGRPIGRARAEQITEVFGVYFIE